MEMAKILQTNNIAYVLKNLRKDSGLTQQDLADKLFCDIRQIRRYETEGTDKISVLNLYADIFNIDTLKIIESAWNLNN